MDRIKRFLDIYVPTEVCNLKCSYCYVNQNNYASGQIGKIGHSPEEIRSALSKMRMGGICLLNFCGSGETLLGDELLPIIHALLEEGHYIQIVTNGTVTKCFDEFLQWEPENMERIFFKFSFHYLELKKRGLLNQYFENVNKMWNAGCSISIELMPHDELMPYVDEIKSISLAHFGALPHLTVGRNEATRELRLLSELSLENYSRFWGQFSSDMFAFKIEMFGKEQRQYCYAGEWSCSLRIDTGDLTQCNGCSYLDNIFKNPSEPLHFRTVGHECPNAHCWNCHAYMALGVFPDGEFPTYSQMRDRVTSDGRHWLNDKVMTFFNQKLSDQNLIYSEKHNPKVLLIGDSIREGYGKMVCDQLNGMYEVIEIPENGRFSSYTLRMLSDWSRSLQIGSDIDIIYWNNGLWDVGRLCGDDPQTPIEDYVTCLNRIIKRLHYLFPNAEIIFASITPVLEYRNDDLMFYRKNSDIQLYNEAAKQVMSKQDVVYDDLYSFVKELDESNYQDWVHFTEKGYLAISRHISETIRLFAIGDKLEEKRY